MASTPGTPGMATVGPTGLYLADHGGANKIYFVGASAPYPVPIPQAKYQVQLYSMRRGASNPGYRAAQIDGAAVGYQDVEFDVTTMTDAMKTALELKYYKSPPAPMELSFDDGINRYLVVWAEDGYKPERWTQDWRKCSCKLKVHVLAKL